MAHKPEDEVIQEVDGAREQVHEGALYRHYKDTDKTYRVLQLGILEATDEVCVIYQAQYGAKLTFVRPLSSWLDRVEWNSESVLRFTKVE